MRVFEIEGTSLLHWRMTVIAEDEEEAADGVQQRIAACIDSGTSPVRFMGLGHRVIRCDLAEPRQLRS